MARRTNRRLGVFGAHRSLHHLQAPSPNRPTARAHASRCVSHTLTNHPTARALASRCVCNTLADGRAVATPILRNASHSGRLGVCSVELVLLPVVAFAKPSDPERIDTLWRGSRRYWERRHPAGSGRAGLQLRGGIYASQRRHASFRTRSMISWRSARLSRQDASAPSTEYPGDAPVRLRPRSPDLAEGLSCLASSCDRVIGVYGPLDGRVY